MLNFKYSETLRFRQKAVFQDYVAENVLIPLLSDNCWMFGLKQSSTNVYPMMMSM